MVRLTGSVFPVDKGVEGLSVRIDEGTCVRSSELDADGSFSKEVEVNGRLIVTVEKDGRPVSVPIDLTRVVKRLEGCAEVPTVDAGTILVGEPSAITIVVRSDRAAEPHDVWLAPEGQSGGFRGGRNQNPGDQQPVLLGTTADGVARVSLPDHLCGSRLVAVGPSGSGVTRLCERRQDGPEPEYVIDTAPWKPFTCRIVDPGGAPVKEARAHLSRSVLCDCYRSILASRSDLPCALEGTSRGDGTVEFQTFAVLLDAAVEVVHEESGTAVVPLALAEAQPIVLSGREVSKGFTIHLVGADGGAAGSLEGAWAEFASQRLAVDDEGHAEVPVGLIYKLPVYVCAGAEGYANRRLYLDALPDGPVVVEMVRLREVDVRVEQIGGAPVAGAKVQLAFRPGYDFQNPAVRTDPQGHARIWVPDSEEAQIVRVTPPEPAVEWARHGDPAIRRADSFEIPPGDSLSVVIRRVDRRIVSCHVKALDMDTGDKLPVERVAWTALGDISETAREPAGVFLTGSDAAACDIVSGEYLVWVQAFGGYAGCRRTWIDREDQVLECYVGRGVDVEGRVLGSDPRLDLADVRVGATIRGLDPSRPYTPSAEVWTGLVKANCDETGAFVLKGLLPGTYDIDIVRPTSATAPIVLDVLAADREVILEWRSP